MTVVTVVGKIMQPLQQKTCNLSLKKESSHSTLGKRTLTHSTTDVMFSGQRFAILTIFLYAFHTKTQIVMKLKTQIVM